MSSCFCFFFHPFLSSLSRFSIQVRLLAWMTSHTVNGGNYLSLFFLLFRFKRSQSCRQTLSNLSLAFRPHSIFRTSFKEINNNCYFLRQQHTSKQSDKIKFISNLTFIYTCWWSNDQNNTNQNWNQLYWRSMFTYKALVYIAVSVLKNRLLEQGK